jgi:hypothetical protein
MAGRGRRDARQEIPLGLVPGQLQSLPIGGHGLVHTTESAEQVRLDRRQVVVPGQSPVPLQLLYLG